MKITPPADDYGLQKLRQADLDKSVKETTETKAYPRIGADNEQREQPQHPLTERRLQRRRKRQRRVVKQSTLLDTRSAHERRTQQRRHDNDAATSTETEENTSTGVDNFV